MKERSLVIGKKFGMLTPIKRIDKRDKYGRNEIFYLCKCDCGKETIVKKAYLICGDTKSCGCLSKVKKELKHLHLEGKRFGKLVAIKFIEEKDNNYAWLCQCDCGKTKIVLTKNLIYGNVKSCGCLRKENIKRSHGDSHSKLYHVYQSMIQRCKNPNAQEFERYGGRGISVCESWHDKYLNFKNWAIHNGYKEGLTLDRINNDGDYCPENCKWATRKEQAQNRCTNVFIEFNGYRHTIAEWAGILGIKYPTFVGYVKRGIAGKYINDYFHSEKLVV